MEIVWTKNIEDCDFRFLDCNCKPIILDNKLFYAYSTIDKKSIYKGHYGTKISIIEIDLKTNGYNEKQKNFNEYKQPQKGTILITNSWLFKIINSKLFLYIGFWLDIKEKEISIANIDMKPEEAKIKLNFFFNNKYLIYNELSTIECFDKITKKSNWKVIIKGYLYTDILLKDDCLTFGSAGAFYCIELESGNILTEYSNSNSSNFEWQKKLLF